MPDPSFTLPTPDDDPYGTHLAWQTGDLSGATLDQARRTRDDIDLNVQLLLTRMPLDRP